MKKCLPVLLLIVLLFSLAACDHDEITVASVIPTEESAAESIAVSTEPSTVPVEAQDTFTFADLKHTTFLCASGAGSWYTELVINTDGSFSGEYYNHENIATAEYPSGTVNLCRFHGQFSQPEQVNAYTYSIDLLQLQCDNRSGTEEILDGIRYCYTDETVGMKDGKEFLLYLPGAPLDALPEEFCYWGIHGNVEETNLPYYGLYNVTAQNGFSSTNLIAEMQEKAASAEREDQYWQDTVSGAATQADMNDAAQARYRLWDELLNELWAALKQVLDADSMRQLTNEELQWIDGKEQAALDDAAQYEGGSLYPTVYYGTAAKLTKERVYELLELLPSDGKATSEAGNAMLEAYRSVLTNILQTQTFPGGKEFGYQDVHDLSENKFAVYDIDADGKDELIVNYVTTYTAGMAEIIYDYDSASGTVWEEFLFFPSVTFYENGVIEAGWSHNQGFGGRFWPYTLYQYDPASDTYTEVGMVDGWDKSVSETGRDGNPFPDEIDQNGDGLVYYIMTEGVYELGTPVDLEVLEQWRNSYIKGANTFSVPYQALTEENIAVLE